MFKLFKYELQGRYKYILGVILGIVLLNAYVIYKANPNSTAYEHGSTIMLAFLIVFAALVICLVSGILLFKRDLYGESGYLMFTLPKRASQITGAKLLTTVFELLVFSVTGGAFVLRNFFATFKKEDIQSFLDDVAKYKIDIFLVALAIVLFVIMVLLLTYLSLTISRAAFGDKKFGKFASFIFFVALCWVVGKISFEVFQNTFDNGNINVSNYGPQLEVVALNIVFCTIIFILTSLLLDKKVDI